MLALIYGMGIGEFVIWAVIVAGVIAIGIVVMNELGYRPPPWAVKIFWIVVLIVVAILAIRFVMTL